MLFWIPKAWSIKINKIEHILHGRQNVWLKNHYLLNLFDLTNKHFPAPFDNFNNFQQGSSSRGPVSLVFPTSDLKLGRNSISKKMFILISMKCSATDGGGNLIWKKWFEGKVNENSISWTDTCSTFLAACLHRLELKYF